MPVPRHHRVGLFSRTEAFPTPRTLRSTSSRTSSSSTLSIDAKDNLPADARMLLDDSEDYKITSPVEKGPWTTPSSWTGRKGTPMDKFKGLLEDATTLKAGYLTPVEKVVSAHLCISVTAQGIVNYYKRLLAPAGSKNPRPYSPFPHMLRRVPHMLRRGPSSGTVTSSPGCTP